jgi:hypothetical protein
MRLAPLAIICLLVFAPTTHLLAQTAPAVTQVTDNTGTTSLITVGSAMFVNGSGFGDTQDSSTLSLKEQ